MVHYLSNLSMFCICGSVIAIHVPGLQNKREHSSNGRKHKKNPQKPIFSKASKIPKDQEARPG